MDEAHMLGLGKYLRLNGYKNQHEIMLHHLDLVTKQCHAAGYHPMIWSDMFFRMTNPDCELHLILPCADQSVRWRNEDKEAYEHILSMANSVICLSDEYTPECMKARNAELVKRADMLIAYASRERSGAGQTVRMAQRKGIPVYNLFASCGKERAQGEN